MKKLKLLILDDDAGFRQNHLDRLENSATIKKYFNPKEVVPGEFEEMLKVLEDRRAVARTGKLETFKDKCILDDCAVFIVDYDLLTLKTGGFITGENISYLARCFSHCGIVIGLNQFGENPFDLSLRGHPESYADVNIGAQQLHLPGLWSDKWTEFRPWSWPIIPEAVVRYERCVAALEGHMNEAILSFLGIPEPIFKLLPRSAAEFIGTHSKASETTFEQFVSSSGNGLRGGRETTSEKCKRRIAVARISKWLERVVLAGQDILVDAPHLTLRFPSLLKGNLRISAAFDKTASIASAGELGINHKSISAYQFAKADWLSRPAWFWPNLASFDKIQEVREPWGNKPTDLAFCEDTSRFLPKKQCHEFVADLPSQFARRYVAKVKGINYRPEVRFSL